MEKHYAQDPGIRSSRSGHKKEEKPVSVLHVHIIRVSFFFWVLIMQLLFAGTIISRGKMKGKTKQTLIKVLIKVTVTTHNLQ